MVVTAAVTAESAFEVTGEGYSPEGEIRRNGKPPEAVDPVVEKMARVSRASAMNREIHDEGGTWKLSGDPTEGALLPFAAKAGLDRAAEATRLARTNMIPFESRAQIHGDAGHGAGGESWLFVKGAPDVILNYCDRQELADGQRAPLDKDYWEKQNEAIASQGEPRAGAGVAAGRKDRREPTSIPRGLHAHAGAARAGRHHRSAARGGDRRRQGMPRGQASA